MSFVGFLHASRDWLIMVEHEAGDELAKEFLPRVVDFYESLPLVLLSALFWKLCFHYTESMHLIASFHALLVAALGSLNLYLGVDHDFEHHLYAIMAGYFLADYFTYCIRHDPIVYLFHHSITVFSTFRMINAGNWASLQYASRCVLLELSTPYLQHFRATKSSVSGLLFVLSFFLVRVVFLTWLSYDGFGVAANRLEKGIIITFTLLNYWWFVMIVRKALHEHKKRAEVQGGKKKA